MKLVAYQRVSTDDKGQDPERQKAPIQARADRDSHQVVAWVTDEGTSGATPPLDRPAVQEAIRLCREHGAKAIIVESVDRWTRGGWKDLGVSMFALQHDHGLDLLVADVEADGWVAELLVGIMATIAKMVRERLVAATKSGIANARRRVHDPSGCEPCTAGQWCPLFRNGREPKPDLTDQEAAVVYAMKKAGKGDRLCALEISRLRGAHEVADPKAARKRRVSKAWIADQLAKRPETLEVLGRVPRPSHERPSRKGPVSGRSAEAAEAEA